MITHYIATAFRHFRRHRATTAINVACLTIGLVCFLAAHWFVTTSRMSDQRFPGADQIYVISQFDSSRSAGAFVEQPVSAWIAGEYLRGEFPELIVSRVSDGSETGEMLTPLVSGSSKAFAHARYADPNFLQVFEFEYLEGSARTAFANPRSVILTQSLATQLFGSAKAAVGGNLVIRNRYDATVSAVIADIAAPSHMQAGEQYQFDALVSMDMYVARKEHDPRRGLALRLWTFTDVLTYARVREGQSLDVATLNQRLTSFATRHVPADAGTKLQYVARPVSDMRMTLWLGSGDVATQLSTLLYVLGTIVLAISCINYANLATALAATRAQEVGMRRVVGAGRVQLLTQHLLESALLTLLALACAGMVVALTIAAIQPAGLGYTTRAVLTDPAFLAVIAGIWVAVTLVSGAYPAFVLANVRPIFAVRGGQLKGSNTLATIFVSVQFIAASFLLTMVLMVLRQSEVITAAALADLPSPVVILRNNVTDAQVPFDVLRAELLRQPHIESVSGSQRTPWSTGFSGTTLSASADPTSATQLAGSDLVNYDFFETLGQRLLAGRAFDRSFGEDDAAHGGVTRNIVVDSTVATLLGFNSPAAAVGKSVYGARTTNTPRAPLTIVGVVEPRSINASVPGSIYGLNTELAVIPSVRIARTEVSAALAEIDAVWTRLAPNMPLQRQFAEEVWEQSLVFSKLIAVLFGGLAVLAGLSAILGLIGMSIHTIERRRREIGVRKTLGASVAQVLSLLIKDASRPVVIGNAIALPLAFLAGQTYLAMFAAAGTTSIAPFMTSLVLTIAIGSAAIVVQAARAARLKPARVLRHE
jgi:putative ABC transport system permease protein